LTLNGGNPIVPVYDNQDRLLTYGTTSYTYGSNGELKTKQIGAGSPSKYTYDALGNLMKVVLPSGTDSIEYLIDGQNRRVGRLLNGVVTRRWLYQNQLNPVGELDGAGNLTRFVYGSRANVPDYLLKGGNVYRLISDHLGSVRLVVDTATGTIAQRIDYDEFGVATVVSGAGFQPFGFAGGLTDSATTLVRFGARDYDPQVGRWTAKDPIGFGGRSTGLYGYVGGDPLNTIDPSGLRPYSACETEKILDRIRRDAQASAFEPLQHRRGQQYDFNSDGQEGDTFVAEGHTLTAAQFGNYAAGFAGGIGYGDAGQFGAELGGMFYEFTNRSGNFDFDAESRPYIEAGFNRAVRENMRPNLGWNSGAAPSDNTGVRGSGSGAFAVCGCD